MIDSHEISFYCAMSNPLPRTGVLLVRRKLYEAGGITDEAAALGAVLESNMGGVAVAPQMNLYRCDH